MNYGMSQPAWLAGRRYNVLHSVLFIVGSSVLMMLVGWLVRSGFLPLQPTDGRALGSFIRIWFLLATMIGLVLPAAALVIWIKHASVRQALLPYMLALIVQLAIEPVFSTVFFHLIAVLIGIVYTVYRLWQIRQAQAIIADAPTLGPRSRQIIRSILMLALVFWSANVVMLLTLQLPRLFPM